MIEANELRIGNATSKGIIVNMLESGVHLGLGKCYGYSELEPIKLTEEILLKCGCNFLNRYSDNILIRENNCIHVPKRTFLSFSYVDGLFELWTKFSEDDDEKEDDVHVLEIPNIKNLHQFQNLYFALTGEELTINL